MGFKSPRLHRASAAPPVGEGGFSFSGARSRQNLLQDVPFQRFAGALSAGDVALIVALQVDPELSRRAEVPREPQRRVCGDPPLAVHDLVDPPGRDADRHGELVLCDAEALDEVLHEDLARVNRLDPVSGSQRSAPLWPSVGPRFAGALKSALRANERPFWP